MKAMILALVTLTFGLSVRADHLKTYHANIASTVTAGDQPTPTPTPPIPEKPVRQAKMKIQISKGTLTHQDASGYQWATETICTQTVPVNVYAPKGDTWGVNDGNSGVTCHSSLGGKPIDVSVGGFIIQYQSRVFDDEPAGQVKSASAFLTVSAENPVSVPLPSAQGLSRAEWSSMILSLIPPFECFNSTSSTCGPAGPEFFTATVEMQDPQ